MPSLLMKISSWHHWCGGWTATAIYWLLLEVLLVGHFVIAGQDHHSRLQSAHSNIFWGILGQKRYLFTQILLMFWWVFFIVPSLVRFLISPLARSLFRVYWNLVCAALQSNCWYDINVFLLVQCLYQNFVRQREFLQSLWKGCAVQQDSYPLKITYRCQQLGHIHRIGVVLEWSYYTVWLPGKFYDFNSTVTKLLTKNV